MAWRPVHLIALIQGLALVGCTNSWEGPPHFLHVETFELETTESEGQPTSRIEEVWLYSETDVL
ncbi:MAG: hypothetical protein ACO3MV_04785, partial [Flavobacteriales bacterium]